MIASSQDRAIRSSTGSRAGFARYAAELQAAPTLVFVGFVGLIVSAASLLLVQSHHDARVATIWSTIVRASLILFVAPLGEVARQSIRRLWRGTAPFGGAEHESRWEWLRSVSLGMLVAVVVATTYFALNESAYAEGRRSGIQTAPWNALTALLMAACGAAFWEEVVFRHGGLNIATAAFYLLLRRHSIRGAFVLGLISSATLFALSHYPFPPMSVVDIYHAGSWAAVWRNVLAPVTPQFIWGVLIGLLYARFGLAACIGGHLVNNVWYIFVLPLVWPG